MSSDIQNRSKSILSKHSNPPLVTQQTTTKNKSQLQPEKRISQIARRIEQTATMIKLPLSLLILATSAQGYTPTTRRTNTRLFSVVETTSDATSDAAAAAGDRDILVRAARGEKVERTPVWLMRQAGRYMADFRKYSDVYPFRHRSETPEIACELSLQCHRAYGKL